MGGDSGLESNTMPNTLSLSQVRSADLLSGGDYFFSFARPVVRLVVIGVTASTMVNVGEIASPDNAHIGSRCVEPGGMICDLGMQDMPE